jgi:hypothetical protein
LAFVVDDTVLMAVTWEGPHGIDKGEMQLSLSHGMARARSLVETIQGCIATGRRVGNR